MSYSLERIRSAIDFGFCKKDKENACYFSGGGKVLCPFLLINEVRSMINGTESAINGIECSINAVRSMINEIVENWCCNRISVFAKGIFEQRNRTNTSKFI